MQDDILHDSSITDDVIIISLRAKKDNLFYVNNIVNALMVITNLLSDK